MGRNELEVKFTELKTESSHKPLMRLTHARTALLLFAGVAFIVLLGWWSLWSQEKQMQSSMLSEARIAAKAINWRHVETLTASETDLASQNYQRLKEQLTSIHSANSQYRFTYLLGQHPDKSIFFYVDSERPDSKDYSPPGQNYTEASESFERIFATGHEAVVGPVEDRWGTWLSAVVPIIDPQTGKILALYGMDKDASDWNRELAIEVSEQMSLCLLFIGPWATFLLLRRRNDHFLSESRQYLLDIIQFFPDATLVIDHEEKVSAWNRAIEELSGVKAEAVLGKGDYEYALAFYAERRPILIDLVFRPDAELERSYHRIERHGDTLVGETYILNKRGEKLFVHCTAAPLRNSRGKIIGAIESIRDISDRKRVDDALRESEEQFRTLSNFAPIGIFKSDCTGNNVYMNPRWEEITGISAQEGMGQGWIKAVHPDDRGEVSKKWLEATVTGGTYTHECRLLTAHNELVWTRSLARPLKGPDGSFAGFVGTVEDITELQRAKQEMLKTQKLESLGVLAGGIAHDFNNILAAILGNVSLARFQAHDPEKVTQRLKNAENATVRAKDLTQQLLTFSQGGNPVKKVIKVDSLLKEAAGFAIHGTAVKIEFGLSDDLWPIEADEGQISQVIHNLVLNAVQAMPDGGTMTFVAHNVHSRQEEKKVVTISVADTGIGIPENLLLSIFDPYFTTKPQGSGLGLASCYSIIKKHEGNITVESTVGKGSTFHISLPAADQVEVTEQAPRLEVLRGKGCVLIMDDEAMIQEILQTMLEELGYLVECTDNGSEAVELYRRRKEAGTPFTAVIMDLTIPGGIGGKETITSIIQYDPQVKAVVSSGYATDPVMANYRDYGFSAVLSKPYRLQELSTILQELFEE